MSSHRPVHSDELRRSISVLSAAEDGWPGEDPALNKGPTPHPTAHPGLLPQGGSSSLGFPPYNRLEFKVGVSKDWRADESKLTGYPVGS